MKVIQLTPAQQTESDTLRAALTTAQQAAAPYNAAVKAASLALQNFMAAVTGTPNPTTAGAAAQRAAGTPFQRPQLTDDGHHIVVW
jgi:hypothetical protein